MTQTMTGRGNFWLDLEKEAVIKAPDKECSSARFELHTMARRLELDL